MIETKRKILVDTQAVPDDYIGVWRRELLETAAIKDDTSLVLWAQTQHYHIDIRVPAARLVNTSAKSLQDYSHDELLLLANQQGFAGITQVIPSHKNSSAVCQWHRRMDFQPTTGARDIGKAVFTDANTLIETGLDEAYLEIWRRLENSQKPCSFKLTTGKNRHGAETKAYLMQAGNFIAYARPRLVELPKATSLINAIERYKPQRELLLDWLDMEISIGEIVDNNHWKIKHSTLPFKEHLIFNLLAD